MTPSLTHRTGLWSSLCIAILGIVLIAANIGIGFSGQWQAWTVMESYAEWNADRRIF